jgi:hypothetical protein
MFRVEDQVSKPTPAQRLQPYLSPDFVDALVGPTFLHSQGDCFPIVLERGILTAGRQVKSEGAQKV